MNRCRESQDCTMACSSMPERNGSARERIAQSKCARAGSLAIADQPQVAQTYLKKNLNAPRPSEHPPVRGGKCQNV